MDRVFVERLSLRGRHGVHAEERAKEQEFLIDISVEIETAKAVGSDSLEDTADYWSFCEIARKIVESNSFYLIERLGHSIARGILADSRIVRVEVTIRKPEALKNGLPGVSIVRTRT